MQQDVEKCLKEGRFATARSLIDVAVPQEKHAAWHAAIDIIQYGQENPKKALALDGVVCDLSEAVVRKAFKLRSVLVHPDKFSSSVAVHAFRQLSSACESILAQLLRRGEPLGTVSSQTVSEKFPWWEPWDDTVSKPSSYSYGLRGCACAAAPAIASLEPKHSEFEAPLRDTADLGASAAADERDVPYGKSSRYAPRSGAECGNESPHHQPAGSTIASGEHKRRRLDRCDLAVDSAMDESWLSGLPNDALTQEVQCRQHYLLAALASRQQVSTRLEALADSEEKIAAAATEAKDTAPLHDLAHGQRSESIGNVAVKNLGLTELRAAVDRSRSCLAGRRSQLTPATASGGFF